MAGSFFLYLALELGFGKVCDVTKVGEGQGVNCRAVECFFLARSAWRIQLLVGSVIRAGTDGHAVGGKLLVAMKREQTQTHSMLRQPTACPPCLPATGNRGGARAEYTSIAY